MTWVEVAKGQAINHNGQRLEGGSRLDVEDRLAAKWLERQLVMPAKAPTRNTPKAS
jgi:hypothetical protein